MRGKGTSHFLRKDAVGITPAYAGKSFYSFNTLCFYQDHPRLCGEKSAEHTGQKRKAGSPPPMRGKDWLRFCQLWRFRITPAYAGKSWFK